MAALPVPALPVGTVEIDGEAVAIRSLSRHQALKLDSYRGREDEAEDYIVACGMVISIEDAHEWRDSVDMATGGKLVDAIIDLSGLSRAKPGEDEDEGEDEAPDEAPDAGAD
jgi:hypothetical protein